MYKPAKFWFHPSGKQPYGSSTREASTHLFHTSLGANKPLLHMCLNAAVLLSEKLSGNI